MYHGTAEVFTDSHSVLAKSYMVSKQDVYSLVFGTSDRVHKNSITWNKGIQVLMRVSNPFQETVFKY